MEWGYLAPAASLAAALLDTFGVTAELVEGHNGVYDVMYGEREVYSNRNALGKVPTNTEVLELISRYIPPLPGKENKAKNIFPVI